MRISIMKAFSILLLAVALVACSNSGGTPLKPITAAQAVILYNPRGNTIDGNPQGTVTLVEFFDYRCFFCRKMLPVVQQLIKDNPQLRVVYKDIVLFGPGSEIAAQAALAASPQGGYLALRQAMLSADKPLKIQEIVQLAKSLNLNTDQLAEAMTSPKVTLQIKENNQFVKDLGLSGAPAFIVTNTTTGTNPQAVNNKQLLWIGAATEKQLQNLIAQVQ